MRRRSSPRFRHRRPVSGRFVTSVADEELFARVGAWCVERPAPVIALAVLLAIVGAIGAASLKPNGEAETLVDKGSETFAATEDFKAEVRRRRGRRPRSRATSSSSSSRQDLGRLLLLEGCLAGNAPAGRDQRQGYPTPEVCNELAESKPARVVYGPATFLNQFAQQASALLRAAGAGGRRRRPTRRRSPPTSRLCGRASREAEAEGRGRGRQAVGPRASSSRQLAAPRRRATASRAPVAQRPELRQPGRVRLALRRRDAEGASSPTSSPRTTRR